MQADGNPLDVAEALMAGGRPKEAAAILSDLIERGRGGLLARFTLVHALLAAGENDEAVRVARETAMLNPSVAQAASSLGEALRVAGVLPTAIGEFQRALRLDPSLDLARVGLGHAWLDAGEPEKALEIFSQIEVVSAELRAAIAQAEAARGQARSDARYVRHLFDQFSADYDARMRGQLGYRGPEILREMASFLLTGRDDLSVLDLGCGTGLAGMAFEDLAARLDGIDLSPAMVEKARSLGIYDALVVGDIESGLTAFDRRYDLILAADTVVYLGDLAKLLDAVRLHLTEDGLLLFTVEKKDGGGFELGPKRRWRHSEAYLREVAAQAGLDAAGLMPASPRSEAGVPVEGLAVALRLAEKVG
ncbi:MAG TPA: methyltransferase domain-containing protein [Rhizomicrobium sp.]|nr:methyltransferase domain-containing protein [Rhizomicrobium sp.]